MATPFDLGILSFIGWIFPMILIFAVCYAVLIYFEIVKNKITKHFEELEKLSPKELVKNRMDKYANMGVFND